LRFVIVLHLFTKRQPKKLFERMINMHHAALYKHAFWMTGKQEVAADMVQETYFQAWQCINSLKSEDKALPWLLTILRRAVYREQRYQYRQIETVEQLSIIDASDHQNDDACLLDIYGALEAISAKHKDVFLLHYLHGFSYNEISEQLEIPKGTVMSRLARARDALQSLLDQTKQDNVIQIGAVLRGQNKNE